MRTVKHRPHHGKWRIESSVDFVTGARKWRVTPPRWAYQPKGKQSFDTYDEALVHVWNAKGKRGIVMPSKTRHGWWFWHHPEGQSGWTQDHTTATTNALGATLATTKEDQA
jgi:hypothetical protein